MDHIANIILDVLAPSIPLAILAGAWLGDRSKLGKAREAEAIRLTLGRES